MSGYKEKSFKPGLAYTKTGKVPQDLHVEHPRWLNPKPRKDELRIGVSDHRTTKDHNFF